METISRKRGVSIAAGAIIGSENWEGPGRARPPRMETICEKRGSTLAAIAGTAVLRDEGLFLRSPHSAGRSVASPRPASLFPAKTIAVAAIETPHFPEIVSNSIPAGLRTDWVPGRSVE